MMTAPALKEPVKNAAPPVQDLERAADREARRAVGAGRQRGEQGADGTATADVEIAGNDGRALHAADHKDAGRGGGRSRGRCTARGS